MRNFKRLISVVFMLLLVVVVVTFVLDNQQPASIHFLAWTMPSLPLAVFVLIALLVGLAVGPLLILVGRLLGRECRKRVKV
ncbi:hypothetical protein D3C77_40810 [compost metagenome]